MNGLLILGFTLSSSFDNLGVGISYGIRKIEVGFVSNLIIAAVCFLFSYSGIVFGEWIALVLPGVLPERLAAWFLLIIGLRIVWLSIPRHHQEGMADKPPSRGIKGVLQYPERADLDQSNDIGFFEALILGCALSLNALTNGVSAGLLGFSPLILSLATATGSFLTIGLGVWLGSKMSNLYIGSLSLGQVGIFVSGMILVLIAANNFV
jgi:putative sporulation protein YtaF